MKTEKIMDAERFMAIYDVIEVFEEFLDAKGILIDNPEKAEADEPSTIYGTDFGDLFEDIENVLIRHELLKPSKE